MPLDRQVHSSMKARCWPRFKWGLALSFLCVAAHAEEIKVLSAGAFKPVLIALQADFESQSGHRLTISNDTAGGLQKRVLAGETFDLVVSSPSSLKAMQKAGKVSDAPPTELARVAIGVAVAPGAPVPDISSVVIVKISPRLKSCGPSAKRPKRIFGPCKSTKTATGTLAALAALRTLSKRNWCSS